MLSCNVFCCAHSPPSTPSTPVKLQFFESLNPLCGFDGKDKLETFMWEQSLKIEPKDAEKWDTVKPSRPPTVLKSPGIKPPKNLASAPSTSGMSNHYGRYRRSGRGLSTSVNNYSPGILSDSFDASQSSLSNLSMEDKNTHFGVVDINPGHSPRYLGDVWRGPQPLFAPSTLRPPPLMPRLRKQKASSTPPSPHATSGSSSQNGQAPPPLFPRRRSPLFSVASPKDFTNTSLHNAPFPSTQKEGTRFVFPPTVPVEAKRSLVSDAPSTSTLPAAPVVPPRRKGDALPPPLPLDTVRTIWNGDAMPDVSDKLSGSTSHTNCCEGISPPPLYPRRSIIGRYTPPPRPPKKNLSRHDLAAEEIATEDASADLQSPPSPPPLPPKTYRSRQCH